MWKGILDTTKSAIAFLQNGKSPPNTPDYQKHLFDNMNHFASKKFFIVFSAALMLAFFYFSSVFILFAMPDKAEYITGYVTMFSKCMEIFAVIIASYIGIQGFVDLKYNSNSNTSLESKTVTENKFENLTTNAKEEDYTLE